MLIEGSQVEGVSSSTNGASMDIEVLIEWWEFAKVFEGVVELLVIEILINLNINEKWIQLWIL